LQVKSEKSLKRFLAGKNCTIKYTSYPYKEFKGAYKRFKYHSSVIILAYY